MAKYGMKKDNYVIALGTDRIPMGEAVHYFTLAAIAEFIDDEDFNIAFLLKVSSHYLFDNEKQEFVDEDVALRYFSSLTTEETKEYAKECERQMSVVVELEKLNAS